MTTTKGDVLDAVMLDVGYPTSDTDLRDVMSAWFDDVFSQILGPAWQWPHRAEIRTISVTADSYTDSSLDTDVLQVRKMRRQGDRQILQPTTVEDLFDSGVDLTDTGTPTRWYPTEWDQTNGKQKFKLWPIPSTNITLELYVDLGAPTPLDAADNIPAPEDVIAVLKDGLRARAYYNESNTEQGLIHEQKFENGLAALKNDASGRPERPSVMRLDGDLRAATMNRNVGVPDRIPYES